MKNLSEMKFGEAMMYVRKKCKGCSSRAILAARTRISSWQIASFEKGESLPTLKELALICNELGNLQLKEIGERDVKICYADNTTCWKCKGKMCSVYGLIDGNPISPDIFNESMLKISREKGVLLAERRSGVTGETHLVNVCPHCGTFIGEFYLHDLWYGETETIQVDDVAEFIREKE